MERAATSASPTLLRVTTRTPFTLAAADVTDIWPVPRRRCRLVAERREVGAVAHVAIEDGLILAVARLCGRGDAPAAHAGAARRHDDMAHEAVGRAGARHRAELG